MDTFWNEVSSARAIRVAATAAIGLLALFLLVKTVDAFHNLGRDTFPTNSITIEGTGTAVSIPDIATVSFTISEEAKTVAEAQSAATKRTDAALASVKAQGVEDKDIKTASYNVNPQYDYPTCSGGYCPGGSPTIRSYQVSQSIEVKVRDTDKVGAVLQGLGDAGVQNVSGPNFGADDPEAIRAEAREKAVADAKEKAKRLADSLGVHLGKVVGFWENTDPVYGGPMYDIKMSAGMAAPAPSVPAGENEVQIRISVTYEIR